MEFSESSFNSLICALKASGPKDVVVIGDLMLDEYVMGGVGRISPEAPVPVLKEEGRDFSFGGATNVAINCRRVGCHVDMIGLLGERDLAGEKLRSMLVEKGVCIDGIVSSPDRVTTRKKRIVSQQQQLLRIDSEQTHSLSPFELERLICNIHTVMQPTGPIILISDYSKGVVNRQIVQEVITRARVCGSLVIADPKGPHFDKYEGVDYVKPNLKEFYQMVDFFGFDREDSIELNGVRICEKLLLKGLVVTMGDRGIQFVSSAKCSFYPACKREVYDITGAGDTVLAFLAVGLVNGFSIDQSLNLANRAASVAVSYHKTYAVCLDDLTDDVGSGDKVCDSWRMLRDELDWLRRDREKKIVFTNGCFDLLHSGHIFLLEEAKKRGDVLVVALNTDDSVKRYKGDHRPIKSLDERVKIISALSVVDYVVTFDQDTPYKLIEFLKPDVLVKGGDYSVEKIAGYDVVVSYGGKVEVVEYQDGHSTTNLVKNVKRIS